MWISNEMNDEFEVALVIFKIVETNMNVERKKTIYAKSV